MSRWNIKEFSSNSRLEGRSLSATQDRITEFRNKLEQSFNQPRVRNLDNWRGFRREMREIPTRVRSPPKLTHYNSVKNFSASRGSSVGSSSGSRTAFLERRQRDLQDAIPLSSLRQAVSILEADFRALPREYISELTRFCELARRKLGTY